MNRSFYTQRKNSESPVLFLSTTLPCAFPLFCQILRVQCFRGFLVAQDYSVLPTDHSEPEDPIFTFGVNLYKISAGRGWGAMASWGRAGRGCRVVRGSGVERPPSRPQICFVTPGTSVKLIQRACYFNCTSMPYQ